MPDPEADFAGREKAQAPPLVTSGKGPGRCVRRWQPEVAEGWDLAKDKEATLRAELFGGSPVDFNTLLILKYWGTLPSDRVHRPCREVGAQYYDRALKAWKAEHERSRVNVFPVGGIYVLPDSTFRYVVLGSAIRFDWTEAERLLLRVDGLAEQAREWWPYRAATAERDGGSTVPPDDDQRDRQIAETVVAAPRPRLPRRIAAWPGEVRRRRAADRARRRSRRAATRATRYGPRNDAQRQPHLDRAFYCVASILNTIALENETNHPVVQPGLWLRGYSLVTAAFAVLDPSFDQYHTLWRSPEPTATFQAHLEVLRVETDRIEGLLDVAAERTAQANYTRGMGLGTGIMIVGSAAVATGLAILHVPAQYAISAPAGALGALVSVFQRMTTGRLHLDLHAGRRLLQLFGAIRPLIGAIFGMAVYAVLKGGVLPAVGAPKAPLAFYGAIGFLAGFNERFAQDMLGESAQEVAIRTLGRTGSA